MFWDLIKLSFYLIRICGTLEIRDSAVTGTVTTEIKGIPQPSASIQKGSKSTKLSMYDNIKHLFQNTLKLAMLNCNLLMNYLVSHRCILRTDFCKCTMGPFGHLSKNRTPILF